MLKSFQPKCKELVSIFQQTTLSFMSYKSKRIFKFSQKVVFLCCNPTEEVIPYYCLVALWSWIRILTAATIRFY